MNPNRIPLMRWTLFAVVAFLGLPLAGAAPVQRDLGEGLAYFRIRQVPADLPADGALGASASVLDLRYATADAAGATVLGGWLKFHANGRSLLLVLVNGGTSPLAQSVLQDRAGLGGLLTIGIAGQKFIADITVADSAQNERQAYQAFDNGATIATLTTDHPGKQRNDEASLSHDRQFAGPADEPGASGAGVKTPPLIDSVLQRAMHLHRALKAAKKA